MERAVYRNIIEKMRPYDYLVGFNPKFDQLRVHILSWEIVPPLNEIISLIRGEESRRNLMMNAMGSENTTFMTKKQNSKRNNSQVKTSSPGNTKGDPRDNLWCTCFPKLSHTHERCYKFHGRPLHHYTQPKGNSQIYVAIETPRKATTCHPKLT